ncbi:GMP synthase [Sulfolobus acidocaldarius SUSAZ]|nr:GMP synthase [Sulfolobus acidocaldarius SUSAZ]
MEFDPKNFTDEVKPQLEKILDGKAIAAVSGGVDSTTAATLTYKLMGDKVIPIIIDTGFLREGEVEKVKNMVKNVLPLQVVDAREKFLRALEGLSDAEEKRKTFRKIFYDILSELVRKYNAKYLIQGTIAADWVETQGGIKTQHNVLVQLGIDTEREWGFKVVEPLADLYKNEVRKLGEYLGLPKEIYNRQPFPGPGLLVRTVGELTVEKLELVRKATTVVEKYLDGMGISQYFAFIFETQSEKHDELSERVGSNVFTYKKIKATGVKGDVRAYGRVAKIETNEEDYEKLRELMEMVTISDITHVVIPVTSREDGEYTVGIRAVSTEDFMTAEITKLDRGILNRIGNEILNISKKIHEVVYDITTKPPATIELE